MNVRCPTCETVYRVDPAKVPRDGVRARCAECAGVIPVPPPGADDRPGAAAALASVPRPFAAPAVPPAAARTAPQPSGAPNVRMTRPISGTPGPAVAPPPRPAPRQPTRPAIVRPAAEESARAKAPAAERPSAPVFRPTEGPPMAAPPVPPKTPLRQPEVRVAPEPRVPISDEVTARRPAIPIASEPATIERTPVTGGPEPRHTVAAPTADADRAKPWDARGHAEAAAPARPKQPINPFLSRDPRQKARRLARALVSDMIVYQPEKRQQALGAGTLKEAFAEEIKKSWEEYVDRVGREIADSTTYFTDALNEILAGGQQIF